MRRLAPVFLPILTLCAGLTAATPAPAQPSAIEMEDVDCIPNNANGVVRATVRPEVAGTETRLYFRWDDHGPFYFVEMEGAGGGRYWATPPKPTDENHQVEYFVALVDATGERVAQNEPAVVPVTRDCDVVLSREEAGMAENLVVGETDEEQMEESVYGFLCDGIISRIGPDGVLRADSICRRCIVAWWDRPDALVPAAILLGGGTTLIEASPSRP